MFTYMSTPSYKKVDLFINTYYYQSGGLELWQQESEKELEPQDCL